MCAYEYVCVYVPVCVCACECVCVRVSLCTYQAAQLGGRGAGSVFEGGPGLAAVGFPQAEVEPGAPGPLGGGAQPPLHPHHLVVGAYAAAHGGWGGRGEEERGEERRGGERRGGEDRREDRKGEERKGEGRRGEDRRGEEMVGRQQRCFV